jgi:hypothetical protein
MNVVVARLIGRPNHSCDGPPPDQSGNYERGRFPMVVVKTHYREGVRSRSGSASRCWLSKLIIGKLRYDIHSGRLYLFSGMEPSFIEKYPFSCYFGQRAIQYVPVAPMRVIGWWRLLGGKVFLVSSLDFYKIIKFQKFRRKPIDNREGLWHNTDVADTDGWKTPDDEPLNKVNPEEIRTQRQSVLARKMSRWFLYLSLNIGEKQRTLLRGKIFNNWRVENHTVTSVEMWCHMRI